MNPATPFLTSSLSPTTIAARGECIADIACFQTLPMLNMRQVHHKSATCLTYRDTAYAPMSGSVQMSSRMQDAGSNGWKNPASAGKLAYRKRAAKLIFGHRDITGAPFLGSTRAVIRGQSDETK
jgi:hypothetical protein